VKLEFSGRLVAIKYRRIEIMSPSNTSYIIDRVLHWSSVLFILAMISMMGSELHNVDYTIKGPVQHKQDAIEFHFIMGMTLLALIISRIAWSGLFLEADKKPQVKSKHHKRLILVMHTAMYGALISMVITGLIMVNNYEHPLSILSTLSFAENGGSLSVFTDARSAHMWLLDSFYVFIVGHVGAVLYNKR